MFVLYQMDIWGYIHMNYTKLFVSCFTWDFGGKNFLASNGNQFVGDSWRWSWYSLFLDETLINFIKTAPSKGGKGGQRERTQVLAKGTQTQRRVTRGQRNKLCSRAPPITRNISKKDWEGKPENVVSLEEPSHMITTHLKIERQLEFTKKLLTQFAYKKIVEPPKEGHQCL
jgi:hypothetical protein